MKLKGKEIIIWDDDEKLGHYFTIEDMIYLEQNNEYIEIYIYIDKKKIEQQKKEIKPLDLLEKDDIIEI